MKPPLKWAGGKRLLAPTIESLWNKSPHARLVEPFAGGLAVSFHISPVRVLANDINPHLINFYEHLQKGLIVDNDFENTKSAFTKERDTFNDLIASDNYLTAEAAKLFYYLNRQCFNGLCRFNNSGGFNTSFGKYAKLSVVKDLTGYVELISDWKFTSVDFEKLEIESSDFVYCDPPYIETDFTKYSKQDFNDKDHIRLANWAAKLPCTTLISNKYTPEIKKLYTSLGFTVEMLEARRNISCDGDRTPAVEILAYKNL